MLDTEIRKMKNVGHRKCSAQRRVDRSPRVKRSGTLGNMEKTPTRSSGAARLGFFDSELALPLLNYYYVRYLGHSDTINYEE